MKIAAAYIRVSTDDQLEYSPDSQLKAIRNYAEKNRMFLPEHYIFVDEGISGRTTGKREDFKRMIMIAKTKPKPFDCILVWKYSRFARNREDSVVYKSMLRKQCGIDVISISESIGDDKMSILFEAMIEAMDEYYSINLAEEVKRGMTEKARRGEVLSKPPFGYKAEDGNFVIIEEEAEVIRNVFKSYATGCGFLNIAKKLNLMGIRTHRDRKIENRTVEYWLHNPVYIGKIRWNPTGKTSRNYNDKNLIISEGTHTPIIDDELWSIVQRRLSDNKARYKKNMREPQKGMSHWLRGILRCGICGHTLSNCRGNYCCSYKSKGLCNGNGSIGAKVVERLIISKLDEIFNCDKIKIEIEQNDREQENESDSDIRLLNTKISEAKRKFERIKDAYENGVDTIEEYKTNKEKINDEIKKLQEAIDKIKSEKENDSPADENQSSNIRGKLLKISDILKSPEVTCEEKNSVLKSVVKEIVKTGEDGRTFRIIFWNIV